MIKRNRLKAYLMSLSFCMSMLISGVGYTQDSASRGDQVPALADIVSKTSTPDKEAVIQEGKRYFYTLLTKLKDVSYDSDKIIIPLPKFSYEIVVDLKCSRSGDLFTPLEMPEIFLQEKDAQEESESTDDLAGFLVGIGKSILKDKAAEHIDQLPVIKAIWQFQSPEAAFIIKLSLLSMEFYQGKNSVLDGVRSAEFYNEVFRLLFRLSNAHLSNSELATEKLSSCLPDVIQAWIQNNHPHIISLIDDVWTALFLNPDDVATVGYQSGGPRVLKMLSFNDESMAKKVFENYKHYDDADFIEAIQNFVKKHNNSYDICPYSITKNYPPVDSDTYSPTQFLIGKNSCMSHECDQTIKEILPDLDAKVLTPGNSYPANFLLKDTQNRWWVIQASNKFEGLETLKLCLVTLVKTCKKYQALKKSSSTYDATDEYDSYDMPALFKSSKIEVLQEKLEKLLAQIDDCKTLLENKKNKKDFIQAVQKQIIEKGARVFDLKKQLKMLTTEQMLGNIIARLFELNPECKQIFYNIMNNADYATLKNEMIQALRFIMKRSHFINKHKHVSSHVMNYCAEKLKMPLLSKLLA